MTTSYLMVHTTYKSIAADAKVLADGYLSKTISEQQFSEVLSAWARNCPNLLFEDEQRDAIAKTLVRFIGKKRAIVLMAGLKQLGA